MVWYRSYDFSVCPYEIHSEEHVFFAKISNRPFYSCVLSALAFE